MKNIFIEGIQGAGKSTLLNNLHKHMPQYKIYYEGDISPVELAWCSYMTKEQYKDTCLKYPGLYNELKQHTIKEDGRIIIDYTHILTDTEGFHKYMGQYEIYNGNLPYKDFKDIILKRYKAFNGTGNIFECSFFQNIIECLMLFYQMADNEIIEFYRDIFAVLEDKDFLMLYIYVADARQTILNIRKERTDANGNELWFPLMVKYLESSPYVKSHYNKEKCAENNSMDILVCHLERRQELEWGIINKIIGNHAVVIPSKEYKIETLVQKL